MESKRIPALDGLRGIAILLVLYSHLMPSVYFERTIPSFQLMGIHGVALFFVLSGYLITTNLRGGVRLQDFYIRRCFRLWPAAWSYMAVLSVFRLISFRDAVSCLLFFRNYLSTVSFTWHFWSLSIEEQFYLIWPVTLLLLKERRAKWLLIGVTIAAGLWKYFHWDILHWRATSLHIDGLAIGCLLALIDEKQLRVVKRLLPIALCWLVLCFARGDGYLVGIGENLCFGVLIVSAKDPGPFARILSFKPLTAIGVFSYSIYIWQSLFLRGLPLTLPSLLVAGFAIPAGWISYSCIEKPMMRFGARLTGRSRISSPSVFPHTCSLSHK